MGEGYQALERRPIRTRDTRFAQRVAAWLANAGVSPNAISIAGMICCIAAGILLAATAHMGNVPGRIAFLLAAGLVQLRLLANLFDGMVAIQTKRASPLGELYNEVPDRVSDFATLVGGGYALGGSIALGYICASIAIFVAYVRAMGKITTDTQDFAGPMAKQHRMAVITIVSVYLAIAPLKWQPFWHGYGLMSAALLLIAIGGLFTAARRLLRIARLLRGKS